MLTFDRLTVSYGAVHAVQDLSFTAPAGAVTGFLGANGAGKSTALSALLGLVRVESGTATIDGRAFRDLPSPARAVGVLLSAAAFHPGRSGRDTLALAALATGAGADRVAEVTDLVGLGHAIGRRVGTYSLGMRQRLGIAHALMAEPPVLVLDEPANGMDPEGIRWMRGLLAGHARRGGTVLVSSHQLAEIQLMADRVVVIDAGRLVAEGSVDELTAASGVLVAATDAEALRIALRGAGLDWHEPEERGGPLLVEADSAAVGALALRHELVLTHLADHRPALEDVYLRLTGAA